MTSPGVIDMDQQRHLTPMRTSISHLRANVTALLLGGAVFAAVVIADWHLWNRWEDDTAYDVSMPVFLIVVFVSIVVHEWLHAFGFRFVAGVPWKDIRISVHWRVLTPYATSTAVIPARAYWWTAALPGIAQGVLPVVLGLAFGVWWLSAYGAMMLSAASGDAMILWMLRKVDPAAPVRDHPTLVGFELATVEGRAP